MLQEFSRTVSTAEGQAFAASRDPPWMFMECSAKKGGEDVSGADGIFSKVVDKVRIDLLLLLDLRVCKYAQCLVFPARPVQVG